jgi:aryl-alcohol dehydrogenase-like predicted oxidoreductase
VAPIVGATKIRHLEDAVAATALRLAPEEVAELEAPYQPHPVRGWLDGSVGGAPRRS